MHTDPGPQIARRRALLRWAAVLLLAPVLIVVVAGYAGPVPTAYVLTWRPWRSSISVRLYATGPGIAEGGPPGLRTCSQLAETAAHYADPYPGETRTPGEQVEFLVFGRAHPLLPWVPTGDGGTGP